MRLLVTGASGQIGTNLALRCLEAGYDVMGVDCRANTWTEDVNQVQCDLTDATATEVLQSMAADEGMPDLVVHLAAHAKVHDLVITPSRAFDNIQMTRQVLEFCRRNALPLVFASSREVYGDSDRPSTREEDAGFMQVASSYAASKIACEAMIQAYTRCYGMRHLVFRLSNVYGRYDDDMQRMSRVVPLFIDRIGRGLPVKVFGEKKILDFTHVDDCVSGMMLGIEHLLVGRIQNRTLNLARGEGNSLLKLARYIGHALHREPKIEVRPPLQGEITRYVANIDRARELLGYAPSITLDQGICKAIHESNAASSTVRT